MCTTCGCNENTDIIKITLPVNLGTKTHNHKQQHNENDCKSEKCGCHEHTEDEPEKHECKCGDDCKCGGNCDGTNCQCGDDCACRTHDEKEKKHDCKCGDDCECDGDCDGNCECGDDCECKKDKKDKKHKKDKHKKKDKKQKSKCGDDCKCGGECDGNCECGDDCECKSKDEHKKYCKCGAHLPDEECTCKKAKKDKKGKKKDKKKKDKKKHSKTIEVEQNILSKNDKKAEKNHKSFTKRNITAINLISSPGSGKTSILEKTIQTLKESNIYVIEGDQQTLNDAIRIKEAGAPVIQINTGTGCHLDAKMIRKAYKKLEVKKDSILFIENIGNLVCPALFDLGEDYREVIISTTEGDDKPLKYPTAFMYADVCIINKIDLLPHVDFSVEKVKEYATQVNSEMIFFELSAKTGEGMDAWCEWLVNGK